MRPQRKVWSFGMEMALAKGFWRDQKYAFPSQCAHSELTDILKSFFKVQTVLSLQWQSWPKYWGHGVVQWHTSSNNMPKLPKDGHPVCGNSWHGSVRSWKINYETRIDGLNVVLSIDIKELQGTTMINWYQELLCEHLEVMETLNQMFNLSIGSGLSWVKVMGEVLSSWQNLLDKSLKIPVAKYFTNSISFVK